MASTSSKNSPQIKVAANTATAQSQSFKVVTADPTALGLFGLASRSAYSKNIKTAQGKELSL